jgi:hypothetical protein
MRNREKRELCVKCNRWADEVNATSTTSNSTTATTAASAAPTVSSPSPANPSPAPTAAAPARTIVVVDRLATAAAAAAATAATTTTTTTAAAPTTLLWGDGQSSTAADDEERNSGAVSAAISTLHDKVSARAVVLSSHPPFPSPRQIRWASERLASSSSINADTEQLLKFLRDCAATIAALRQIA